MIIDFLYNILFAIPESFTQVLSQISGYMPDVSFGLDFLLLGINWSYGILHLFDGYFDEHNLVWAVQIMYWNLWIMLGISFVVISIRRIIQIFRPGAAI